MENVKEIMKNPVAFTEEELIAGLKQSEDDIKNGRVITFEDWCKEWKEKYGI